MAFPSSTSREEVEIDKALVSSFVKFGDEDAFAKIVARHRDRLFMLSFRLLKNRSDAEEVIQDTFIRAHRGLGKFRGESSLATWLYQIALNLSRNRHWYNLRRRKQDTLSLDYSHGNEFSNPFADGIASSEQTPANVLVVAESIQLIAVCMEKLNQQQREILLLRNVKNMSYDEIGAALNINVGTVKSRIARARSELRKLMLEQVPDIAEGQDLAQFFHPERSHQGTIAIAS